MINSLFGGSRASSPSQGIPTPLEDASNSSKKEFSKASESELSQPLLRLEQSPEHQSQIVPRQNNAPYVFAAGVAFTALSALVTRRSIARRRIIPRSLQANGSPKDGGQVQAPTVSPGLEAFEALNVATINVLSLATMATGGLLWYLDIANMEEARIKLRGGMGFDGTGRSEAEAEEEYEEWLATVLSRKEAKDRRREYEREKKDKRTNDRGKER